MKLIDIPLIKYSNIRERIQNGDLIFFIGRHIGDWFLKKHASMNGAEIPVTHVAILRRDFDRVKMMEAVFPLSREVNLSNFLKGFKGDVIFTKVCTGTKNKVKDEDLRQKVIKKAVDLSGRHYENIPSMSWSFITSHFKGIEGSSKIYCSEYASLVWYKSGIPLLHKEIVLHPAPYQLFNSPLLKPIGRLESPIKLS